MPYEKLLELVESKKLDITTINLAEVTADFLKYAQSIENQIEPHILSDFIFIAAKLILIKSKTLLPEIQLTEEEETDVKELESRLILYKQFKVAGELIKSIWQQNKISISRSFLKNTDSVFRPPRQLSAIDFLSALANLSIEIEQLVSETKTIKIDFVSIEEKMVDLINQFNEEPRNLNQLVQNKSRSEIIAIFLAVLHLFKKQKINIDQNQWINLA